MKLFKLGLVSLCMLGLLSTGLSAAKYKIPAECKAMKPTDTTDAVAMKAYQDCVKEKGTKIESMDPAVAPDVPDVPADAPEVMNSDDDSGDGE